MPQLHAPLHEQAKVTVIHARLGEPAFGTSPGFGSVMATLRSYSLELMEEIKARCVDLVDGIASAFGLRSDVSWCEAFPVTQNHSDAVDLIQATAEDLGYACHLAPHPFPWSEDFGHFTNAFPGAMFGLGAGRDCPAVHHRRYDFPDALIPLSVRLLTHVTTRALGASPGTPPELEDGGQS